MKKILNDLKLKFDNPKWALDPELALIDTVLEQHPELYEIVKENIITVGKDSEIGRQDSPTVKQIVRAALYKELKKLDSRDLEYAQYDSKREFIYRLYVVFEQPMIWFAAQCPEI
jgi:IS5 family transposase